MKSRGILSWASVLLLTCGMASYAYAQGDASNTTPEHKGNTGWTGGARDQPSQSGESSTTIGKSAPDAIIQSPQDAEAASTQPPMATGTDLNGPAQRFPPSKTPE
jgi:hypothetical protein